MENLFQGHYTNRTWMQDGIENSGWTAFGFSEQMPVEQRKKITTLMSRNSRLDSIIRPQNKDQSLLELYTSSWGPVLIHSKFGLLDRGGRPNMFASSLCTPWNLELIEDIEPFLSLKDQSFFNQTDNIEDEIQPYSDSEIFSGKENTDLMDRLKNYDIENLKTLVRCAYVRLLDPKKITPLYISCRPDGDDAFALFEWIFCNLPIFMRKNLSVSFEPCGYPDQKTFVFTEHAVNEKLFVDPLTGENTVLKRRTQAMLDNNPYLEDILKISNLHEKFEYAKELEDYANTHSDGQSDSALVYKAANIWQNHLDSHNLNPALLAQVSTLLQSGLRPDDELNHWLSDVLNTIVKKRSLIADPLYRQYLDYNHRTDCQELKDSIFSYQILLMEQGNDDQIVREFNSFTQTDQDQTLRYLAKLENLHSFELCICNMIEQIANPSNKNGWDQLKEIKEYTIELLKKNPYLNGSASKPEIESPADPGIESPADPGIEPAAESGTESATEIFTLSPPLNDQRHPTEAKLLRSAKKQNEKSYLTQPVVKALQKAGLALCYSDITDPEATTEALSKFDLLVPGDLLEHFQILDVVDIDEVKEAFWKEFSFEDYKQKSETGQSVYDDLFLDYDLKSRLLFTFENQDNNDLFNRYHSDYDPSTFKKKPGEDLSIVEQTALLYDSILQAAWTEEFKNQNPDTSQFQDFREFFLHQTCPEIMKPERDAEYKYQANCLLFSEILNKDRETEKYENLIRLYLEQPDFDQLKALDQKLISVFDDVKDNKTWVEMNRFIIDQLASRLKYQETIKLQSLDPDQTCLSIDPWLILGRNDIQLKNPFEIFDRNSSNVISPETNVSIRQNSLLLKPDFQQYALDYLNEHPEHKKVISGWLKEAKKLTRSSSSKSRRSRNQTSMKINEEAETLYSDSLQNQSAEAPSLSDKNLETGSLSSKNLETSPLCDQSLDRIDYADKSRKSRSDKNKDSSIDKAELQDQSVKKKTGSKNRTSLEQENINYRKPDLSNPESVSSSKSQQEETGIKKVFNNFFRSKKRNG